MSSCEPPPSSSPFLQLFKYLMRTSDLALAGLEGAHVVSDTHAGHAPCVGGGGPGPVHAPRTRTKRHHLEKI
jgi:hypothetical protein